jgi:hypothetical protein
MYEAALYMFENYIGIIWLDGRIRDRHKAFMRSETRQIRR